MHLLNAGLASISGWGGWVIERSSQSFKLQAGASKVNEQSYFFSGCAKVVDELSGMLRGKGFNALQLDNDAIINEDIGEKFPNMAFSKINMHRGLDFDIEPLFL
jgi:hypothetical protein